MRTVAGIAAVAAAGSILVGRPCSWPSTITRLAFTQILPDQKADTTIAFLRDALDFFARHGIRVRALLTDNGNSYRSHLFRRACQQLGLQHHRICPYSPQTNGKAERFIQTALREWAYATQWRDSTERNLALPPWNHYYNHQRPHGSLNHESRN